jgi:hypothetical protein
MGPDNHLPACILSGTGLPGLPVVDIWYLDLSDEELGTEIVAHYEAGRTAAQEGIDRLVTVGSLLIEARSRTPNFDAFLRDHCSGLSRSWAYDLIDIAR